MTTQATKLTTDGPPDGSGRQKYEPLISTVIAVSKYNADQFGLQGLTGYWQWSKTPPLKVGQKAKFWLTTKPKTGPSAKPGALYMDIAGWEAISPDADGNEYQNVGTSEGPAASSPPTEAASNAPEPRSPLAGIEVPPEWKNPIEYHIHMKAIERASIETQVAYKGLIEVLPSVEDPIERVRITAVIQELAARLGRFTWPERDVVANNGEGVPEAKW